MLDLTIINTAIFTVQALSTWISQLQSKQKKIRQLDRTVSSLLLVLEPLRLDPSEPPPYTDVDTPTVDLDKASIALIYDLLEILNGIKDHLTLWNGPTKSSKLVNVLGWFNPSIALGMLRDDEHKLEQRIQLFTLSLQVMVLKKQAGQVKVAVHASEGKNWTNLVHANDDISSFWNQNVGEKVFIESEQLITFVERWIQKDMDETTRNALLLEIDRGGMGGVTQKALQRYAGGRTLKECITELEIDSHEAGTSLDADSQNSVPVAENARTGDTSTAAQMKPTLVWIDDNIVNNNQYIMYATIRNINVVPLSSTAITQLWIEKNEAELRALEAQNLLYFITDNARWESFTLLTQSHRASGGGSERALLNLSAGETILRYLRGHRFKAPVLVFCGFSIALTHYVEMFSGAASTCHPELVKAFIDRLARANTTSGLFESNAPGNSKSREISFQEFAIHTGFNLGWGSFT